MWIPRELRFSECSFTYIMTPSDENVREAIIKCGSESIDNERVKEIHRRIDAGDYWAWCDIDVIAKWEGFKGSHTRYVSTYAGKVDFEQHVLGEMKLMALADLNAEIRRMCLKLSELM